MSGFPFRCSLAFPLLVFLAAAPDLRAQTSAPAATPVPFTLIPPVDAPTLGAPLPAAPSASSRFVPPKIAKRAPVVYPEVAHLNRREGVVGVRFSIDETGHVTHAIVVKSSGSVMLDTMVRDYNLTQWQFTPATLDGVPVPSTKDQEFEFRLDPEQEKAIAIKRLALPVGTPDAPYPKEALPRRSRGSATICVRWTKAGLVDLIYLSKSSGSSILDDAAMRWAYENWHVDPATINDKNKDDVFSKTLSFEPPK